MQDCGWPPEKVEALLKDAPVVLAEWREAMTGQHGGDRKRASTKRFVTMMVTVA
jgi:hypothetical protein